MESICIALNSFSKPQEGFGGKAS